MDTLTDGCCSSAHSIVHVMLDSPSLLLMVGGAPVDVCASTIGLSSQEISVDVNAEFQNIGGKQAECAETIIK